jgi:hypothetical protein
MSSSYIIETRRGAAGIVVRDGRGFRFFAAQCLFNCLDGHLFATPRAAEAAARDCLCGANWQRGAPNQLQVPNFIRPITKDPRTASSIGRPRQNGRS